MIPRWLCVLLRRHKGLVGYTDEIGPFWLCTTCGTVVR